MWHYVCGGNIYLLDVLVAEMVSGESMYPHQIGLMPKKRMGVIDKEESTSFIIDIGFCFGVKE